MSVQNDRSPSDQNDRLVVLRESQGSNPLVEVVVHCNSDIASTVKQPQES